MSVYHSLAIDLGAGSGRVILGAFEHNNIRLKEIHRFSNEMILVNGHYHWDTQRQMNEILKGIRLCARQEGVIPDSVGVDTWGVDFALLDSAGELLIQPFAYRDTLTDTAMDEVFSRIPPRELYRITGIQLMPFNSLFQLWALKQKYPALLARAKYLLFMPDFLGYQLSGKTYAEYTIASTSQILNPYSEKWNSELLHQLELPPDLLQTPVDPGTRVGLLKNDLSEAVQIPRIPVTTVGSHDTASAVVAIPASHSDWAFISSGTWSLMGIELDEPVINDLSYRYGFTNEGGVGHKIRFLKNITGLWLLQECKKNWDKENNHTYEELIALARAETPFRSLVDPDDSTFQHPTDMPAAIRRYCRKNHQPSPETPGQFTRCILESLALKYRHTLNQLREVTGRKIEILQVIGGGSKNDLLCEMTAHSTGLRVVAGPAEGTALGNILVQISAKGMLRDLDEMRRVVNNSVVTTTYEPRNNREWDEAYERFKKYVD